MPLSAHQLRQLGDIGRDASRLGRIYVSAVLNVADLQQPEQFGREPQIASD